MTKYCLFVLVLLLTGFFGYAEKCAAFSQLNNPAQIAVDKENIYITERAIIYLYSAKDFTLKKTFGREGEGPQEFKRYAVVIPQENQLLVNSIGKVSFFKKDGTFLKEVKTKSEAAFYKPLGNNLVGRGFSVTTSKKEKTNYKTINLYDSDLNKIKEVFKQELDWQIGKGTKQYHLSFSYRTHKKKLYIAGKNDFVIDVFDADGKQLSTIRRDYEKVPFTKEHKEAMFKYVKLLGHNVEAFKKNARFPDHFPAIADIQVEDGRIYARTYKKKANTYELFIFDSEGKLLKETTLPCVDKGFMAPYPNTIQNRVLYQLLENDETETIELHAFKIE